MSSLRETYAERKVREDREERVLADLFPDMKHRHEKLVGFLETTLSDFDDEYRRFRREVIGSPYERLMLAGRLTDMCDADAARLLNREIDPLTFDDVLASIERLASKVRALKERAELAKAEE
jgi:hypothetical protein